MEILADITSKPCQITVISHTSFAITEFLFKLDCQRGIHPKIFM
jgi:hypothetical protein